MEQTYRITIITAEGVIEIDFHKRETAIATIEKIKERLDDFVIGILSKKANGKWNPVYSTNNA